MVAVGAAIVCTGGAALVGGAIAGGVQAITGTFWGPLGTIIGGAANGIGSFATDVLDNNDASVSKKKTNEQIVQDAEAGAIKGMVFSLPGAFMQGATSANTVAESLMPGYNQRVVNGMNQFYGAIDNGLIAADSTGNLFDQSIYEGAKE